MKISFNRLDYAMRLETAGMTAAQADLQSQLLAEVLGGWSTSRSSQLAFERNLMLRIDACAQRYSGELDSMVLRIERRLVTHTWMMGFSIALSAATALKVFMG